MKKEAALFKYESSINEILEIAYSFQKCRVLLTACELDIFSIIGDGSRSIEALAAETGCDPKALERLMHVLCSMSLVEKVEDAFSGKEVYSNSPIARDLLVRGKPNYMSNLRHLNKLWNVWSGLTEAIKSGSRPESNKKILSKAELEDFISAMNWRAQKQAPEIVRMMNFERVYSVLDLGCGSGAFAIEIKRQYPDIKVFAYDKPEVVPITEKYIEMAGLTGEIDIIPGDFLKDDIPGIYDIVFMSQVIHSNSTWKNIELASKLYDNLTATGQLVIHDFLINEDRISPQFSSLFSLNMLVNTEDGDVYSFTEVCIMLKEAWFSEFRRMVSSMGSDLIIAMK